MVCLEEGMGLTWHPPLQAQCRWPRGQPARRQTCARSGRPSLVPGWRGTCHGLSWQKSEHETWRPRSMEGTAATSYRDGGRGVRRALQRGCATCYRDTPLFRAHSCRTAQPYMDRDRPQHACAVSGSRIRVMRASVGTTRSCSCTFAAEEGWHGRVRDGAAQSWSRRLVSTKLWPTFCRADEIFQGVAVYIVLERERER